MARDPSPIRPLMKHANDYESELRRDYVRPLIRRIQRRLATVQGAAQAIRAVEDEVDDLLAQPVHGIPTSDIQRALNRMNGWHYQRMVATFRTALGVDIRALMAAPEVNQFMTAKLTENIDLIKTIPERLHASLARHISAEFVQAPFDQQALSRILRQEFKSSGWNLRRLTRDQVGKSIGNLNQIRQRQIGIDSYIWVSSQDQRVRPTHAANSGRMFAWSAPPAATGHPGQDVLCRCIPRAIITDSLRNRLRGVAGPQSLI